MSRFQAHGCFDVEAIERCLIISVKGAFNQEGSVALANESLRIAVERYSDDMPWAVILDLTEFELATADSVTVARQVYIKSAIHNQRYEAVVGLQNIVQKEQLMIFTSDVGAEIEFNYFDDLGAAKDWLKSLDMLSS